MGRSVVSRRERRRRKNRKSRLNNTNEEEVFCVDLAKHKPFDQDEYQRRRLSLAQKLATASLENPGKSLEELLEDERKITYEFTKSVQGKLCTEYICVMGESEKDGWNPCSYRKFLHNNNMCLCMMCYYHADNNPGVDAEFLEMVEVEKKRLSQKAETEAEPLFYHCLKHDCMVDSYASCHMCEDSDQEVSEENQKKRLREAEGEAEPLFNLCLKHDHMTDSYVSCHMCDEEEDEE